ncbi:MAG: M14 family metallocarboxypeptidase [Gammaproteobacteria bacterium]|nr:M14 family metallocarboxypeptidase [Gammaproteobacteria bacterium]
MNQQVSTYPIGTPGQAWGNAEKAEWLARQRVKRSYADEVIIRIDGLRADFDVQQYGALPYDTGRYPLFLVLSREFDEDKPTVLVTGGVHGYETSGVQGALRFMKTRARSLESQFNFVCAPCISPWGYETINRWNPGAVDPNRSFYPDSGSPEAASIMQAIEQGGWRFIAHFDLHETTDSDNDEFRPALAARDGKTMDNWHIPDGFYTVGDSARPEPGFQGAIIRSVKKVTHIAPPDADGGIIGEKLQQEGVINYDARKHSLCMGMTDARFVTTTEVYPDSPRVTDENCTDAQVAAVCGGLEEIS